MLAIIVAACNKNSVAVMPLVNEDAIGFARFREMKAMEAQTMALRITRLPL